MATVKCDFRCDLTKPIKVEYLDGNMFTLDNGGNTINVYCYEGEEPATMGGSVSANVIRPDGTTVPVSGAIDGNKAYVTLPQAAYAVPGHVTIIIKVTQSTTVTTIAAIVANNMLSSTDTIVDPGTIIPSVQDLIAQIETAVGSIPADYSALLATLAADYSSSKTYAVGDYAWQAGVLKRCIVPITTAETYTAAHWTNAVLGDDLSALKSALSATVYEPGYTWEIGKTIGSTGTIGTATAGAHTDAVEVTGGAVIERITPLNDANSKLLIIHVCQYKNGVFQSRTSLATDSLLTLEDDTDAVAFNFTRQAVTQIAMTQNDIDTYFGVKIYQQTLPAAVFESETTRNVISKLLVASDYSGLLSNLEKNVCGWAQKSAFSDSPSNMDSFFEVACLSSEDDADSRTPPSSVGFQIAFSPNDGNLAMRRIQSGSWNAWTEIINVTSNASAPRYIAFGDSLTWGSVWDSDQSTDLYQADFADQIPTRIANAIGSKVFNNYAVSGSRFVKQGDSDTAHIIGDAVKAASLGNIDIVTIGGGRNDSATALGDGATATANNGTICGAMVDILTYLTTNFPKLQIAVYGVTPQPDGVHLDPEYIFTRVFSGGWSLATYYTEMAKVCSRFGVPFIDWYDCPLILRWGVLSGGYSGGVRNWAHPLESALYKQMGNYIGGRVSAYYKG